MFDVLRLRENILATFKSHENIFKFIYRFFLGLLIFFSITSIDFYNIYLLRYFQLPYSIINGIIFAVIFATMSLKFSYFIIIIHIALAFSISFEISIFVFLLLMAIFFLYIIFDTKEIILIIYLIMCFWLKIPYVIPLIAGLYYGLSSIIPIFIANFLWHQLGGFRDIFVSYGPNIVTSKTNVEIFSIILDQIFNNSIWIVQSVAFTLVFVVVFTMSKRMIDYSKEIAIIFGGILNIFVHSILFGIMGIKISYLSIMFFSGISICVCIAIKFFDCVLDYQKSEYLEFEDDQNYYFLKVIPKMGYKAFLPKRKAKIVEEINKNQEISPDISKNDNKKSTNKKNVDNIGKNPIKRRGKRRIK